MEYTVEELRALIAAAVGERKADFERQLTQAVATAAAADGGGSPTADPAKPAKAAADPAKPDKANATRVEPDKEPVAAAAALDPTKRATSAAAAAVVPAINGPAVPGVTIQAQAQVDIQISNMGKGRYRYPRFFQAAARGKSPLNLIRRLPKDDMALATTVIGLHQFLVADDRAGARRFMKERALSEGIGAAGGFLVPEEFAQEVIEKLGELTIFATTEFLRVFPMSTDVMKVPVLDTRPDVDVIAEAASGDTGQDPEIGQVELVARKFGRVLPLSEELVADTSIAILEFLVDLYAEILAEKRTELVTNGNGASEPEGVRQNTSVPTSAFTGTQTNSSDVLDWIEAIFWAIKAKYRINGIWLATAAMLETLSTIKDGNGRPILSQITDEPFMRLKGRPVFENSFIPDNLGGGSDESELIFGNFKFYIFGDRQQMTVATDRGGLYFRDDQVALKINERYDGRVGQAEAFIRGTGKTVS